VESGLQVAFHAVTPESEVRVKKNVMKGLGDLLQMVAPGLDGLYDVSMRIGARTPATIPRAGSIPRVARRRPGGDATREPLVDVFDEGDTIVVVAQLPGVDERFAQWLFRDPSHLAIRGDAGDRKYAKDLDLPAAVDEQATVSSFANGILELTLWKRR
jgi:HSP20 family protein